MANERWLRRGLVLAGAGFALVIGHAFLPAAPPRAEAGIVILNNGKVFVGRIRKKNDTPETVLLQWPYKQYLHRGHQLFEHGNAKHQIRWHWRNPDPSKYPDLPTEEYWEKYNDTEKFPIESKYLPLLERWKLGRKAKTEVTELVVVQDDPLAKGQRLSPIPVDTEHFKIQKPEGWRSSIEDGIVIFSATKQGTDGFRPRIHVFAVARVEKSTNEQVQWILGQIGRVGDGSFDVKERKRLRTHARGSDQEILTRTVRKGRPVLALRQFYFRDKMCYFYPAYAHESDFGGHDTLFRRCMDSLQIKEDKKRGGKKKTRKKKRRGRK